MLVHNSLLMKELALFPRHEIRDNVAYSYFGSIRVYLAMQMRTGENPCLYFLYLQVSSGLDMSYSGLWMERMGRDILWGT